MRHRLRSHLTYANVMATLAVFLVLGGGTALGAYVVSSNSQIGPGTVSGHNPPAGKHANILAGSVNGQDVQDLKFQSLTLKNGWVGDVGYCANSGTPQIAKSVDGVVRLRGAVCLANGNSGNPFAVPAAFKPTKTEIFPVNQFFCCTGQLVIYPSGEAYVADDPDNHTGVSVFTSLSGVSYTLPY
jgi:hypothetical protein